MIRNRCCVILFCGAIGWAVQVALAGDYLSLPRGKGEACVEPTELMRKEHMTFLLHQRDQTVHQGIRTKRHSLTGCIDCHVQSDSQGRFIAVDAPGQFCQVCHTFASVEMDCFECHRTTPDNDAIQMKTRLFQSPGRRVKAIAFSSVGG